MVVLTKIFGVDHINTKLFNNKAAALAEAKEDIKVIKEDSFNIEENMIDKGNKIFIVINNSRNPFDYIEYVISECSIGG